MIEEQIKIGTPVIYWAIIKENGERKGPLKTEITSEAYRLGDDELVCKVKGKSGAVSIKHLDTITTGSLMAARLQGLQEITDEDIKSSTKNFFNNKGVSALVTILSFKKYKRKGLSEMIPVTEFTENGGDLSKVSLSSPDHLLQTHDPNEFELGFVARNPKNHDDLWYVSKKYFDENLEPA